MRSFRYVFEELPLVILGGYAACDVAGFAEIEYDMSGAWSVQRIGFDGWRRRASASSEAAGAVHSDRPAARFERSAVWLDLGDPIQMIVYHRLEHEWRARVQDQVDARICDDRDGLGADQRADHAMALRRELT